MRITKRKVFTSLLLVIIGGISYLLIANQRAEDYCDRALTKFTLVVQNAKQRPWDNFYTLEEQTLEIIKDIASKPNANKKIIIYVSKGTELIRKGNLNEALKEYKKAIEIEPSYSKTYALLGYVYLLQRKFYKAIIECGNSIRLDPNYSKAHYNLAIAYIGEMMYDEALAESKIAFKLDPDDSMVNNNLGWLYYYINNYDEAIKFLEQAIKLNPYQFAPNITLADLYYKKGEYKRARENYDKAISLGMTEAEIPAYLVEGLSEYH